MTEYYMGGDDCYCALFFLYTMWEYLYLPIASQQACLTTKSL